MVLKLKHVFLLTAITGIITAGCSEDETNPDPTEAQTIEVLSDQAPDNGRVTLSKVISDQAGWVVIHRDNGSGAPMVPQIIGKAQVSTGTNNDVMITLDSTVTDGEILWAMLHVDDGQAGTYEFTGSGSPDQPAMEDGAIVMRSFTINQTDPLVEVSDQTQLNNGVTIASVKSPENGFIVIHAGSTSGTPAEVLGFTPVQAGENTNVMVTLDKSATGTVEDGDKLWAMLHYDRGTEGTYEFPGTDIPVTVNGEVVMQSFVVSGEAPQLTVNDQSGGNSVTIATVSVQGPAWVVIHRDNGSNGPVVPGIIGKTRLYNGTGTDVEIQLDESVNTGQKLWAMLHYDTGIIGTYEFNGSNGLDLPIIVDGNIRMQSFMIQ